MYSKTHLYIQNKEATIREYKKALLDGALELADRIYTSNPDLVTEFGYVGRGGK